MRITKNFVGALAALTTIVASGCISTSSLQTARALDPSSGRLILGGGLYESPELNEAASLAGAGDISLPFLEVGYRHGLIKEGLEVGAKLTLPGTFTVDGKYQFLDKGTLAVAAGLMYGSLSIRSDVGGGEDLDYRVSDITIPVYASVHPVDYFAFYLVPKYIMRTVEGDSSSNVGATGGIQLGKKVGVMLEASYLSNLDSDADFSSMQYTGAIFFGG